MKVFVNRTLNMKKIKAIGFDMDYTLVRYHSDSYEKEAWSCMIDKLVKLKGYPESIRGLEFKFNQVIQGLVIDKARGNLLKLSCFGKVKTAYHGTERLEFHEQQSLYSGLEIDLRDPNILSLDTFFSVAMGILYSQLVSHKKIVAPKMPDFATIATDLKEVLNCIHQDGTLKYIVKENIEKFIVQDPKLPKLLEGYKGAGKKLIIITNSDYEYTKLLMDYAFTPFLDHYKSWSDLFDVVITKACKPHYFTGGSDYLRVNPADGSMTNEIGDITSGIFQGGNAKKLAKDMVIKPEEMLYLGDHIYGDVVSLKKTFGWRTALVFEPLFEELKSIAVGRPLQEAIDHNMQEKLKLENELNDNYSSGSKPDSGKINKLYMEIEKINEKISSDIEEYQKAFNPYWGELMRAGYEESRLAGQVQKYACIYTATVAGLLENSPRTYYRPIKRELPHEL